MRKFIVHTRALPGHKSEINLYVVEVEAQMVKAVEDPSVMWLPEGEFRFRITAPAMLFEPKEIPQPSGPAKKEMVPPVYYSHAMYYTCIQATVAAERIVEESLKFEIRKGQRESYTYEELRTKCAEIQTIMLP